MTHHLQTAGTIQLNKMNNRRCVDRILYVYRLKFACTCVPGYLMVAKKSKIQKLKEIWKSISMYDNIDMRRHGSPRYETTYPQNSISKALHLDKMKEPNVDHQSSCSFIIAIYVPSSLSSSTIQIVSIPNEFRMNKPKWNKSVRRNSLKLYYEEILRITSPLFNSMKFRGKNATKMK